MRDLSSASARFGDAILEELVTSLVSIISVADLSYMALKVRSETYRILEVLTAMAVLYWLLGYPQAKLVDWIQRRFGVTE